ncbi:hypothetical protein BDZ91DRAFT_403236 [Kalaharituber pfeilii]|nr:hypothetical protein BDZ91DRAFT_403236 [Kalaharituber pfeilii]
MLALVLDWNTKPVASTPYNVRHVVGNSVGRGHHQCTLYTEILTSTLIGLAMKSEYLHPQIEARDMFRLRISELTLGYLGCLFASISIIYISVAQIALLQQASNM